MKRILLIFLTVVILFVLGLGAIVTLNHEKRSNPVNQMDSKDLIKQENSPSNRVRNKGSTPLPVVAGKVLVQSTKGMDDLKKASEEAKQTVESFPINKTNGKLKEKGGIIK